MSSNKDISRKVGVRSKCITCAKQYYSDNRKKRKLRDRKRKEAAVNFRLVINTSCRINSASTGKSISSPTLEIFGKANKKYKSWIDYQFSTERNWSKIGIDQMRPNSLFDISNTDEIKEAFTWKKTQPLI